MREATRLIAAGDRAGGYPVCLEKGIVADARNAVKYRAYNCRSECALITCATLDEKSSNDFQFLAQRMTDKTLKVDGETFEGTVKNLLDSPPVKREDVTMRKKKSEKLIPPQR